MIAADACQAPPAVEINIVVKGATQPTLTWRFDVINGDSTLVGPNGDFDLRKKADPVVVVMHLVDKTDPTAVFYQSPQFDVFGFMEQDEGTAYNPNDIIPVADPSTHHQFHLVKVSDAGKTVTFCYMNKAKFRYSRYAVYLGDATHPPAWPVLWIDPRITNGQFGGN